MTDFNPTYPTYGWTATACSPDGSPLTEAELKPFKEASEKLFKIWGGPAYMILDGEIGGLKSGNILARVTGEFTGEDDNCFWPPEKVAEIAKSAEWRKEHYVGYEKENLRTFLNVCAEVGLSIRFELTRS